MCIRLFADDTILYIIVDNLQQTANLLNADLAKIHLLGSKWQFHAYFKSTKSEFMILSQNTKKLLHPSLNMDQQSINEVTSQKRLGLIFSTDCS